MTTIKELYDLFGVSPDCTDDELRRAYLFMVRQHHPDMNPGRVEIATAKTQELTKAYAELKKYRQSYTVDSTADHKVSSEGWVETIVEASFTFSFLFSGVDIEDIARRKKSFRDAWNAFRQNPSDVIRSLQLVHAAFEAERQDVIHDLLHNPTLIDAASLLLFFLEHELACETLVKWAKFLYQNQLGEESIRILEDVFYSGGDTSDVREELRRKHYGFAQGYVPETKRKPEPEIRIKHLTRILELGFNYDYIYKLLAEAYHELGNNEKARDHLEQAYKINPQLSGAIKISRYLGLLPEERKASSKTKKRKKYKYTVPEQIPSSSQIQKWAANGNWDDILTFADINNYSPRIISKARNTFRHIASALGSYNDSRAIETLEKLAYSVYWDVRETSILSLAKIGDRHTLKFLRNLPPDNGRLETCRKNAISHLKARLTNQLKAKTDSPPDELIKLAKQTFYKTDYGQTIFLLEDIASTIKQDHPLYFDMKVLLARAYAAMGDSSAAIHLIKPVLDKLPAQYRRQIDKEIVDWIWNRLVFEVYDSANDEDYLLAVGIHLDNTLTSNSPDEVLKNLRDLTRWLEILGEGDMAEWIRMLIKTEAPGTWYVDSHNRGKYIRQFQLSSYMRPQIDAIMDRIKTCVPGKISQVLKSQTLNDVDHKSGNALDDKSIKS
ncbi:DnaJ domain-containing protein [Acidobacteriota bacterium]